MKTIRVAGKARLKVTPDTARITAVLEKTEKAYEDALRSAAEDTECLRALVAGFGFAKDGLKTLSFNVDTEYESYQEHGVFKQRLVGYRARHEMKLEFASDNALLGRLLYAFANSPVNPELRLSYTVKDPDAAKNALLELAVQNAKEKAAVLARAAGVKLDEIREIDYSFEPASLETRPVNRLFAAKSAVADTAGFEMNISPDDIEISDTVTVVWEID